MVMNFAVNNMTQYFLLKKFDGNIILTLNHIAESIRLKYGNSAYILSKSTSKILDYLINYRTRINGFLKNTASSYYKAYNSKLYLTSNVDTTVSNEDEDEASVEFTNSSSKTLSIKNAFSSYINRIGTDSIIIDKVAANTQIKREILEELFVKILHDKESTDYLIDAIFESINSFDSNICDKYFLFKTVKFLSSKYNDNKLKPAVEKVLSEKYPKYKTLASSSQSRYKRALVIMLSIYLQRANCR
jgi:hypothetical protein